MGIGSAVAIAWQAGLRVGTSVWDPSRLGYLMTTNIIVCVYGTHLL